MVKMSDFVGVNIAVALIGGQDVVAFKITCVKSRSSFLELAILEWHDFL